MKTIAAAALICLIIALVLPLSLAPGAWDGAEPEEDAPAAGADADTEFTVLSGGEAERVNMADYLPGVVAAEMPALFEPDALKAQAVAARSFILSRTLTVNANHPEADVCDDPDCCKAHNTEEELREKWGGDYDDTGRRCSPPSARRTGSTLNTAASRYSLPSTPPPPG